MGYMFVGKRSGIAASKVAPDTRLCLPTNVFGLIVFTHCINMSRISVVPRVFCTEYICVELDWSRYCNCYLKKLFNSLCDAVSWWWEYTAVCVCVCSSAFLRTSHLFRYFNVKW
jgi:hypothetical protein